jgi:hypothetical protein
MAFLKVHVWVPQTPPPVAAVSVKLKVSSTNKEYVVGVGESVGAVNVEA